MKTNSRVHPLLIALAAAIILPWLMGLAGLTTTSATEVVIFALACMGLNLLAGYTGLVSFGHGAWFGLGAYIAALVALAVLGVAVWFTAGSSALWLHASGLERVIRLTLLVIGGMAVYFATLFALGFRVRDFRRRAAT